MKAPVEILSVWNRFDGIPMETFTKGWWYTECGGRPRQRTVDQMVEHRRIYGAGGNCFDLALWLRHELVAAGVTARIIGHDLGGPEAHVAVLAADPWGCEFLCDLGDQWLQPILIDARSPARSDSWHSGFFPGRAVQIARTDDHLQVLYRRANGKVGMQSYQLQPMSDSAFAEACHHSQNLLRHPFCEMRLRHPDTGTVEHWEYDDGASFWNLENGPVFEEACTCQAEWVALIAERTGISTDLIDRAFKAYYQFAAR